MPYLKIQLNRSLEAEKSQPFLALVSQQTAKELGKPESYVMAELTTNPAMLFAGTDEPAAYVELKSIGLPSVQHKALSQLLCSLLEQELGVPPGRIYIEFTDVKGACWGWNGSTF
ncbi:MAG: phenylpyruvate tautomerase MIF-related protein [Methylococcaceae bacterium]|nr:phenylpyruvate tautomerase MIF-related protein [Methylococcaceae bacterium]